MRRFAFRLALQLGMTVRELLSRIGSDELTEWMAFHALEPFGDVRADYRAGVIASTFANAHRAASAPPFRPDDFMPFVDRPPPPDDPKINVAKFKALFAHKVKPHG